MALLASPVVGRALAKMTYRPGSREDLHEYWMEPWDGANLPKDYLEPTERTDFLVQIVSRFAQPRARILEVGCNVGRNLNSLFGPGFREALAGIEISAEAVRIMNETALRLPRPRVSTMRPWRMS
jgi:SAM-dependent methyltransferase